MSAGMIISVTVLSEQNVKGHSICTTIIIVQKHEHRVKWKGTVFRARLNNCVWINSRVNFFILISFTFFLNQICLYEWASYLQRWFLMRNLHINALLHWAFLMLSITIVYLLSSSKIVVLKHLIWGLQHITKNNYWGPKELSLMWNNYLLVHTVLEIKLRHYKIFN